MTELKTLNQWRKERGLDVKTLAEQVGVPAPTLSNWLYAGATPGMKRGLLIARVLEVDAATILWGVSDPPEEDVPPMPRSPAYDPSVKTFQVSREQYEMALIWLAASKNRSQIAEAMGVSRAALYKAMARFEDEDSTPKVKSPQKSRRALP